MMLSKYWSVEAELISWTAWNAAMIHTPNHWPLIVFVIVGGAGKYEL
jgi:hypothetical protein